MTRTIYSKAPITEAVIEIRTPSDGAGDFTAIQKIQKKLQPKYPNAADVIQNELKLQLGPKPLAESTSQIKGVRLTGGNSSDVIQIRPGGIVVSRLAPYDRWESLLANAKEAWTFFKEEVRPIRVTRMSVRYINRFDLPGPSVQLRDYFTVYPQLPEVDGFKSVAGMLLQLQLPQPTIGGALVLNQALVPPVVAGSVAIVLDLDLFSEIGWSAEGDEIWKFAEKLQVTKNQVFESIISEKTRGLIL